MIRISSSLLTAVILLFATDAHALPWPHAKKGAKAAQFVSFEACMQELARKVPRQVSTLAFGRELAIACRAEEAIARGQSTPCAMLKAYGAKKKCQRHVAIVTGRWRACPSHGYPRVHEGLCVALARRDSSFCRLAEDAEQGACVGALGGPRACGQQKSQDKARCLAAATLWKGRLEAQKKLLPSGYQPVLELRASAPSGTRLPAGAVSVDSKRLARGVLIADRPGPGDHFVIAYDLAPQSRIKAAYDKLKLELWVPLTTSGTPGKVKLAANRGGGQLSYSLSGPYRYVKLPIASGEVAFSRFERKVGGRIVATFKLTATDGVDRVELEGRLDTFVRELLPLARVALAMRYRTGSSKTRYRYHRGRLTVEEVAQVKKSIRKLSEERYLVDPALRDAIIKDTALFTTAASIYPRSRTPKGYSLSSVYRNSVLWQLGLRDRDVLLEVNRRALASKEDALLAYARLRRARTIKLLIERDGKTLTFSYRVKRVRKKKDGKLVLAPKNAPRSAGILGALKAASKVRYKSLFGPGGSAPSGLQGTVVGSGGLGLRGTGRGGGGRGYGKISVGGTKKKKDKKKSAP